MPLSFPTDATSITIHLNELKNKFDQCMRNGDTFANIRKMYMQIKELECMLRVLIWDPQSSGVAGRSTAL